MIMQTEDASPRGVVGHVDGQHRQFPQEIVEEIIQKAWRAAAQEYWHRALYDTLWAAHPVLGETVDRAAAEYIVICSDPWIDEDVDVNLERYRVILERLDDQPGLGATPRACTQAERLKRSHLFLDAYFSRDSKPRGAAHKMLLRCILDGVMSATVRRKYWPESPDGLGRLGKQLTHLHLDYDYKHFPFGIPTPFPALLFLRTRTCPCCGMASLAHSLHVPLGHGGACVADGAFRRTYPRLRALQLDAPLLLKHLNVPETLREITLGAPPDMKPFCSVQGYNVSAALRRWLRPGEDAQALAAEGPPALESIVVWTGKEEPVGLAEVASACESFGLAFARELVYSS